MSKTEKVENSKVVWEREGNKWRKKRREGEKGNTV